jgi:hypothetical protein
MLSASPKSKLAGLESARDTFGATGLEVAVI